MEKAFQEAQTVGCHQKVKPSSQAISKSVEVQKVHHAGQDATNQEFHFTAKKMPDFKSLHSKWNSPAAKIAPKTHRDSVKAVQGVQGGNDAGNKQVVKTDLQIKRRKESLLKAQHSRQSIVHSNRQSIRL
jgi:hypothetical protein